MKREDLRRLFARARDLCGETDYVVFGSLAVLGHAGEVPPRMAASIDVDAYSKNDPGRVFELRQALGLGSAFESEHGYYLDPISPRVATLPSGWEARLVRIELELGLAAWFLEPNDAAVSKYARMEPRDREWIRPGLRAGVLSLSILDARFAQTSFVDAAESARARTALEADRRWLRTRPPRPTLARRLPRGQPSRRTRTAPRTAEPRPSAKPPRSRRTGS